MSEVKRWEPRNTVVGYDMQPLPDGSFVLFDDFDRVTAERDAALTDRDYCKRIAEHNKEIGEQLQQRLTAADERADVLEGLLRLTKTYGGLAPAWHDAVEAALKTTGDEQGCSACGSPANDWGCSQCKPF